MRRNRNTKILATLGPASESLEVIERLFLAGADVFRLNFSHGTHENKKQIYKIIRQLEAKYHRPIGILADLQGPKLRIGTFKDGPIAISEGHELTFHLDEVEGDAHNVTLPHPEIFAAVEAGAMLFMDDGNVRVRITKSEPRKLTTEVVAGTKLSDRKGVNVPDTVLPLSAITPKDREDLVYALELGVDWVALSFVQQAADLHEARALIGGKAQLMAKIEKPSAVRHLKDIVDASDGVMVARGDLGVEMPPETVPAWQKEIIRACRMSGKPVVVATQMLESMISSPTPTRAEASDVATAVFDGADAVMLSAESAAGSYPAEAVSVMNRIIRQTEQGRFYRPAIEALNEEFEDEFRPGALDKAISSAAASVAKTIGATCVVTHTRSGRTAYRAARERPVAPIVCITQSEQAARTLCLVWGVHAVKTEQIPNVSAAVEVAREATVRHGFANRGDLIVMTAGAPFGRAGSTNTLRIVDIPS